MPRLRRILARTVFLGVAATQSGCCCPGDDPSIEVDLARGSPDIAALIDRCEADARDCEALCHAALAEHFADDTSYYEILECEMTPTPEGARVRVAFYDGSACGRAPEGLHACEASVAGDPIDRWLARAAYLEAASVIAFVRLAADLVHHRAPRELIAAAITAAYDEVRHARIMRALIGGRVHLPVPRVGVYEPADLRSLALHNATEGCARETIGAAVNLWQAHTAHDPRLRAAFADIARDELAHAELSWAIHAWALDRLDAPDRATVVLAQRLAMSRCLDELACDPAADALGLPSPDQTRALVASLAV
jgi:hypothetical protein